MTVPTDPNASTEPVAAKPLCDLYGCGMPAVGAVRNLNHCYNHKGWTTSAEAEVLRAQKKAAGG